MSLIWTGRDPEPDDLDDAARFLTFVASAGILAAIAAILGAGRG